MVYVQPDDVRAVLSSSAASVEGTAASLDNTQLQQAIDAAEAEIDARLSQRYEVPFVVATLPKLVKDIARDIAAYLADLVYRGNVDYSSDTDPVMLRYRRAEKLLEQLASGEIVVPTYGDPDVSEVVRPRIRNPYIGELFGLEDFHLVHDPDQPIWSRR